ncbi:MAG: DUF2156 domain-containing protein [Candidatus Lokiarchaeota archaeon]|nr:DUF2156 domain-containing protein [Candidatus Lokiarchaeota archaeon]
MDLTHAKSIEISDKPIFEKYFNNFQPIISEFTFTNLFAWQEYYQFLFLEYNNYLLIFSKNFLKEKITPISKIENPIYFLPPIGEDPIDMIFFLFKNIKNLEIHKLPYTISQEIKEKKEFLSLNLELQDDRDHWDYVYKKTELMDLPGNRFRAKRNHLKYFLQNYDYEFHLINKELLESCKTFQNEWCIQNECQKHQDLNEEQNAITQMINHYSDLKFRGGILFVDSIPVAYTFGEILNNNTGVIHIEKAHTNYRGSYQAINKFFIQNCCQEVKYVNREQDLGIEGLRTAKLSYNPDHMIKKSILFKKTS